MELIWIHKLDSNWTMVVVYYDKDNNLAIHGSLPFSFQAFLGKFLFSLFSHCPCLSRSFFLIFSSCVFLFLHSHSLISSSSFAIYLFSFSSMWKVEWLSLTLSLFSLPIPDVHVFVHIFFLLIVFILLWDKLMCPCFRTYFTWPLSLNFNATKAITKWKNKKQRCASPTWWWWWCLDSRNPNPYLKLSLGNY